MIITDEIEIPDDELTWSFARAGGPGGQNVNKVSSKAILRWDMARNRSLSAEVKARLAARSPSRLTADGAVLIASQETRDQSRNKQDCLAKLASLIRAALVVPRPRIKTRPTKGSKVRRLVAKKRNSLRKADRRTSGDED